MNAVSPPSREWAVLADLLHRFREIAHHPTMKALGPHYDVVITAAGTDAVQLLKLMDEHPGGCGPVICERGRPWLYWVVPPSTAQKWDNRFAAGLGALWKIAWPPMHHESPPGRHWVRSFKVNQCVGLGLLADTLKAVRPEFTPHASLRALLGLPPGAPRPARRVGRAS